MGETKRLPDDELVNCFNVLSSDGYARYSLKLQDHIAWQDTEIAQLKKMLHDLTPLGSKFVDNPENCVRWIEATLSQRLAQVVEAKQEIAQLTAELQAAGERENALREALTIVLDEYTLAEDLRAVVHAALATPSSAYAQRAKKVAAVVKAARKVIQTAEGNQREEIHLLAAALAALDDLPTASSPVANVEVEG